VKTRTLLLLAVGCGLIILVAGSIKLFLIADDSGTPKLSVGASGEAGGMTVTLESVRRTADRTLLEVSLIGIDDPDATASRFGYGIVGAVLEPAAPSAEDGEPCGATSRTVATHCVLAFETTEAPGVLIYTSDDESLRWDVGG
jgi:hypothetical protein